MTSLMSLVSDGGLSESATFVGIVKKRCVQMYNVWLRSVFFLCSMNDIVLHKEPSSMLSFGMCSSARVPSLQIPCDRSISPGSPKSWEESLIELSKGLQVICGSPEEPENGKGLGLLSPSKLSPPSPAQQSNVGGLPTIHEYKRTCSMLSPPWQTNSGVPWTPNSSPCSEYKPLLVRHEESHDKLQEKLAKICKKPSKPEDGEEEEDPASETGFRHKENYMLRRESLKLGFRFHQDLSDCDVDKLLVAVDDSGVLTVAVIADWSDSARLSEVQLPSATDLSKMVCTVSVCNVLYLRERSSVILNFHSTGLTKTFLPIVIEDEANARVKCILHIPDHFKAEDVNVKTLDDHLVVSCSDKTSSTSFKMDVQLPDGVETRTISAKISNRNQLLVSGVLGSSSRRYTF
ncbi:hypothetical protein CAPTEDRAFT_204443 [Capitella teleta]|uniref:SHSP domain-containing protein n=1 Tax=Capitella teleta TaxID=283909 RepID=R7V855_CAPTE|nr:hypothetical protein CAPTEDRAFT_204443 [Capitella teleta]|eukprot:ELU14699.1 hypothetical protein CAPTEDRAFT_204443 [Capitella teleta]